MTPITPRFRLPVRHGEIVAHPARETAVSSPSASLQPTREGAAALAAAQELARKSSAPATLRAYKADWIHFSDWCAAKGFVPVPAAPEVVGAYLASLAETHAPATIRRRLSALGKMHRYNDLPWNAAHGAIQGPLQGLLRQHGRPPRRPLPCRWRCCASCSRPASVPRAAGATARCCCLASPARSAAPNWCLSASKTWWWTGTGCACAFFSRQDRPGRAGG